MTNNKTVISNTIRFILFFAFLIVIIMCINIVGEGTMTNRESTLLGILIAVLSVLASWIITELYANSQHKSAIEEVKEQHQANLRTYALKASEKVNNLSNELNKLSLYLEQELNLTEHGSLDEELQAKEERIESAIHIISTLKSINDTSLSDWEGVIGDELNQQREEREEKEEELKSVIERAESLIEDQKQGLIGSQRNTESLRKELEHLKHDLRSAMMQLSGTPFPGRTLRKNKKEEISNKCPICGEQITYKQKTSVTSIKSINCPQCGKKLISRFSEEKGFTLISRDIISKICTCPKCGIQCEVSLDNFPGSAVLSMCNNCQSLLRVIQQADGSIDIRDATPSQPSTASKPLSESVISLVKDRLPQQPWPHGIHKTVAQELGIPTGIVSRSILELIRQKVFYPQVDGVVYIPKTDNKK